MSRKIEKQIRINNQGGKVFKALTDPGLIKKWWGASQAIVVPDENGIYALSWGTHPDTPDHITTARISEYKPYVNLGLKNFTRFTPNRDEQTGTDLKFLIDCQSNYCTLKVQHWGFPQENHADELFDYWNNEWDKILSSLKQVVESEPASVN